MSFLDDVCNFVRGVVEAAVNLTVGIVQFVGAVFSQIGHDFASVSEFFRTGLEQALGSVLPKEVARFVTLSWYLVEVAVQLSADAIDHITRAFSTGKLLDVINVLKPLTATAMRNGQLEARDRSQPIPPAVLSLIPSEKDRHWLSEHSRYTVLSRIDDKRFAEVWSFFSGHIQAVVVVDIVVFRKEPDITNPADLFLWMHELKHVLQVRDKGVDEFVSDYIDDVLNRRTVENKKVPMLEQAADEYACGIIHGVTPGYIPKCPHS